MEIRDRVLKVEPVDWKKMKFLQTETFKTFSDELRQRLRQSMVNNHFVETFKVWQDGKDLYCLDGYHRCLVLKEIEASGYTVPAKFKAEYIDCKNKEEAGRLVLVYSSAYAEVNRAGLAHFALAHSLDLDALSDEVNLQFSGIGDELIDLDEPSKAEYPITARFSEKYDYVLVFCKNDIDFNNLSEVLKLKHEKSYKSTQVGTGRVLTYERFIALWNNRKS